MEPLGTHQVDVVVEIPRGSRNKYEIDDEGVVRLNRRVFGPVAFPADYGFIQGATGSDGDALDALVLLDEPTFPGVHVRARVIGGYRLRIGDALEDKIVCVAVTDPAWDETHELDDLTASTREEIGAFFTMYRRLEQGPTPHVEELLDVAAAWRLVQDGSAASA